MDDGSRGSRRETLLREIDARMDTPEFREKVEASFREGSVPESGICRESGRGGRIMKTGVQTLSRWVRIQHAVLPDMRA